MRILANYGYRANGDTYSVTFETLGDVPKEQADSVVDELFRMAKTAIQRQINGEADAEVSASRSNTSKNNSIRDPLEFPPKEEVVVPKPKKTGNGNGKPQLKDPDAPATKKQKSLIIRLAKERGQFIENLNELTMKEASETIDELMAATV